MIKIAQNVSGHSAIQLIVGFWAKLNEQLLLKRKNIEEEDIPIRKQNKFVLF